MSLKHPYQVGSTFLENGAANTIDGMTFRLLFLARKIPKIPPAHPETLHKWLP
jgi:hypothetical protein